MSVRTGLSQARGRIATTVAVGAALVLSGLGAIPADAHGTPSKALTVDYVSLFTSSTKVTSSTGHHLRVSVYVSRQTGQKPTVGVALRATHESHTWSFKAPSTAFKLDSTGKGTVTLSASKMGGYGQLKLHVKPVGSAKLTKCQGQVVSKSRPVAISGTMFVNTKSSGSHKWGTVGSKTRTFSFARPNAVNWSYQHTANCPTTPNPCYASLYWSTSMSSAHGYTSLSGGASGTSTYLSASRSTNLSKPAGAVRYDYVSVKAPAPKLNVANDGSAVLTASLGKGSAKIKSPQGTDYLSPCGTGSKQEHTFSWAGSYTNGATTLKAPAQIYGSISVKNNADRGYINKTNISG